MHAFARKRVQIGWKRRNKGLAFAGLHFGNVALMEEDASLELDIKGAQAQGPTCAFAAVGKGLG
jgi:hypothetical protein